MLCPTFKLAPSVGCDLRTNCDISFQKSIPKTNVDGDPLTVEEFVWGAVGKCPYWVAKIAKRHPGVPVEEPSVVLFCFGCGYETLVLLDCGEEAIPKCWGEVPRVLVTAFISPCKKEGGQLPHLGSLFKGTPIADHLLAFRKIYIETGNDCGLCVDVKTGPFHRDQGSDDRKKVLRARTTPANRFFCVNLKETKLVADSPRAAEKAVMKGDRPNEFKSKGDSDEGSKNKKPAAKRRNTNPKTNRHDPAPSMSQGETGVIKSQQAQQANYQTQQKAIAKKKSQGKAKAKNNSQVESPVANPKDQPADKTKGKAKTRSKVPVETGASNVKIPAQQKNSQSQQKPRTKQATPVAKAPPADVAAAAEESPKRKRGRPKGSKNKPKDEGSAKKKRPSSNKKASKVAKPAPEQKRNGQEGEEDLI